MNGMWLPPCRCSHQPDEHDAGHACTLCACMFYVPQQPVRVVDECVIPSLYHPTRGPMRFDPPVRVPAGAALYVGSASIVIVDQGVTTTYDVALDLPAPDLPPSWFPATDHVVTLIVPEERDYGIAIRRAERVSFENCTFDDAQRSLGERWADLERDITRHAIRVLTACAVAGAGAALAIIRYTHNPRRKNR